MDPERELLRHAVATVAYRGGKALRGAPPEFADFHAGPGTRTPAQILAHISDLYSWALSIARGSEKWVDSTPQVWAEEVSRFFSSLAAFDRFLASDAKLAATPAKLLQGPVADSLTHVGQLAMLRRLAEAPIKAESYYRAEISVGRVGPDQSPPRREFD
jgi:hypothetical protein